MTEAVLMSQVVCGFGVRKTYQGQKDFDETYKSVELKKKLIPIGQKNDKGEYEDFVEEVVEIVTETPIKDVIASQNDSCGLEAYLRPYRMAGENPPDVEIDDKVNDFTQFDENVDLRCSGMVEKYFQALPQDLRQKYGSPEKLLREVTDSVIEDSIKNYVESLQKKPEIEKGEEK